MKTTCPDCGAAVARHKPRGVLFELDRTTGRLTHSCSPRTTMTIFSQPAERPAPPPIPAGVLRGPADADHYRVKVGRYGDRWYTDPLPTCPIAPASDAVWPSVSSIKKASGSDWTFVGLKRVAEALRDTPGCLDNLDYDACYDRLKSINKIGLGRAASRGTNVHLMFENGLRGAPLTQGLTEGSPGWEYLSAVDAFFEREQPELIAAEVVTINRTLHSVGYGGTGDAAAALRVQGVTAWMDYKSRGIDSSHGAYPEESAQIAGYTSADYMLVEGDNGPERRALPAFDCGVIISVKPDGYRIYPIDLEQATAHWQALHAWWVARRSEREAIGRPWAPRSATPRLDLISEVQAARTPDDLMALYQRAVEQGVWTDDVRALFSARKAELLSSAA